MIIQINDTYFITNDTRNIICNKKTPNAKDSTKEDTISRTYHPTLANAVKWIAEDIKKGDSVKSIESLKMVLIDFESNLMKLITQLEKSGGVSNVSDIGGQETTEG
ncbi:hypothetical protein [Listeria booriae]|uniref:hypothetical protein n=1 Tax=Listeria booriae TaxID=1552123 RepID=UPI0016266CEE|nr:hypothetical protein [Listeria booriae]MBC2196829.1 hypothetical protein [Listeria booriae]MBC2392224.1 hypothetical protein [Listeria booriae]